MKYPHGFPRRLLAETGLSPFTLDVKSALLSCGILLALILYLLGK